VRGRVSFGSLLLALGFLGTANLRLTTTGSLPDGLYWAFHSENLDSGNLLLACPPPPAARLARARGYLEGGSCPGGSEPLGKIALATSGDLVVLAPSEITVNGRPIPSSAPLLWDSRGRPLPRWAFGSYRLAPGEIWLYSPHSRSFDSRYFGPIAASAARGRLLPVLVVPNGSALPGYRVRSLSAKAE
jgi:conjugative transfer signal peptidase TraF